MRIWDYEAAFTGHGTFIRQHRIALESGSLSHSGPDEVDVTTKSAREEFRIDHKGHIDSTHSHSISV